MPYTGDGSMNHYVISSTVLIASVYFTAVAVCPAIKRENPAISDTSPITLSISACENVYTEGFSLRVRFTNVGKEGLYVYVISSVIDDLIIRDGNKHIRPVPTGCIPYTSAPSPESFVFLGPGDVFETTWKYNVVIVKLPINIFAEALIDIGKVFGDSVAGLLKDKYMQSKRCINQTYYLYPIINNSYSLHIERGHPPTIVQNENERTPEGLTVKCPVEKYFHRKVFTGTIISNQVQLKFKDNKSVKGAIKGIKGISPISGG